MTKQEDIKIIKGTEHPEEFNPTSRKREEIREDAIVITKNQLYSEGIRDEQRLAVRAIQIVDQIFGRLSEKGVVIKVDRELLIISRERAEFSVPKTDCGGRKYTPVEWEDNVRYLLEGAEIQRDKDKFDSSFVAVESLK